MNLSVKIHPDETILLVDDEPLVRDTLQCLLETLGQKCDSASSAEEALEMIAQCSYDLVLTDMYMPGLTGLDLIENLRTIDDSIPVILVTGHPSIESAVDAMKRGAVDFIAKPFDIEVVRHVIGKALQERRLRQENRRLQADVNKAAVIEKLNRELNGKLDELTRLYTITEALSDFMDANDIFEKVVRLASKVTGGQRVSLMLFDRQRRYLKIRSALGLPHDVVQATKVQFGERVSGKVAQSGKSVRVTRGTLHDNSDRPELDHICQSRSWLSLPLYIGDQIFGVMNLTDKLDRSDFSENDENIIKILLEKAGIKLENEALYEGIYANLVDTLNSLVTTIEAKDVYTRDHSQRVTDYALAIGRVLEIGEEDLEMIDFAGLLHDIGKIGVRDEILTKTGKLTDEEFDAIKEHPLIGEKIVAPLGLNPVERSIIRNHHERFDGKGYPDALEGDAIPYLARIVGVADALDAMTSTRSYRQALSIERAISELEKNRGSQFDPKIVDALLIAIKEGKILIGPVEESENGSAEASA